MQNYHQSDQQPYAPREDEIDLRELFGVVWAGRKIIGAVTALFTVLAISIAFMLPNQYQASAVISPAQNQGNSMFGAMSQLGGLASLAGIGFEGSESGEIQEALEIMQSWGFIEKFILSKGLAIKVFAAKGWDPDTNELLIDEDVYDRQSKRWVRTPPSGKSVAPSSWELYEEFSDRLTVSQDKATGLITVSIEYYSPKLAQHWVAAFISAVNEHMRERKLHQVNSNIKYLQAQIEQTALADMKAVFYKIIEEQIKNKMLAEATPEYAFVTVSPAMVPEQKSQPKRAFICIFGALLGGMLATLIVLVRHYR